MNKGLGIKIVGARALVLEEKQDNKLKSGIVIPGKEKESTFRGTVIAVGEGARADDGTLIPMVVEVGQKVIFQNWSGSPILIEDETFLILNERDILCIIEE